MGPSYHMLNQEDYSYMIIANNHLSNILSPHHQTAIPTPSFMDSTHPSYPTADSFSALRQGSESQWLVK